MNTPSFKEDHISQIPAIQLLVKLGYEYLPPDEAVRLRGGKTSGVLLDGILEGQLRKINKIQFKGQQYEFSEGNIQSAIASLKDEPLDGLIRTNEKIYDLLCLGKSAQQSIMGDSKSFQFNYVDWNNIQNNAFHVTAEYTVERTASHETRRPDIVLFVNGIPFCVIECKRPDLVTDNEPGIERAIKQQIRNQKDDEIPKLFMYSQLLLVMDKNNAKYGTTGTDMKFWSAWREKELDEKALLKIVNAPLDYEQKGKLFSGPFTYARNEFDRKEQEDICITEQDKAIYSLCRPERLLDLTYRYILFDAGVKKIARYQQYFCVRKIVDRIRDIGKDGKRKGGVVWHTQGSGKSLTMVLLAEAIALEKIPDYKIVLVTDRVDLDDQLYKTFKHCGAEAIQSEKGSHLLELLKGNKQRIITTIINKFNGAFRFGNYKNENPNIFVLVDEGHRGQYKIFHAQMKKILPNACFIAFTGTPIMLKEKNTLEKFGGLIDPYTIVQAVEDNAVVPLLYEGRHVEQYVEKEGIDRWFEKETAKLTKEQAADLKKKFATTDQLNRAAQKIKCIAWDISRHYKDNFGNPFKAQIVTQGKEVALLYKKFLDSFGIVTSEVLISPPDIKEGDSESIDKDVFEDDKVSVNRFWDNMMTRFGGEKEYNRQIINAFKKANDPEIIIVVDKLLTGFDAPRDTVLYITRKLKGHTLLQAIARVNRLYPGKEYGYIIDYRGILENLNKALDLYSKMPEFDKEDLEGILTDLSEEIAKLPQRHSDVWEIFNSISNKRDEEAFELLLSDEAIRARFYEKLSLYARTLSNAFSSDKFLDETPEKKISKYRYDLKFFMNLRNSVRKRYSEVVDFREYEDKIQKLIDTYVGTGEVETITELTNIFDKDALSKEIEKLPNAASRADTIAYRTKKTISELMQEDPAYYMKFSEMLEEVIRAFRQQRLSAVEYLRKVMSISNSVINKAGDEIPQAVSKNDVKGAFYRTFREMLKKTDGIEKVEDIGIKASLGTYDIVERLRIVNWINNDDVKNQMRNEIEDLLFDIQEEYKYKLSFDVIDEILETCLNIAMKKLAM
jgi:type I restriction enzyme R subunit